MLAVCLPRINTKLNGLGQRGSVTGWVSYTRLCSRHPVSTLCNQLLKQFKQLCVENSEEEGGKTAECITVKMIAINIHKNWLMPIGARECNLKIQHNSIRLLLKVLSVSNFGVHHCSILNSICLWLCPSFLKWRDTGVMSPSFRLMLCAHTSFS